MTGKKTEIFIAENSFCSELLFKDWESFLDVLYSEGGRIASILWWDHCRKSQQRESVGSGGYIDPDDPDYMYAETHLYKDELDSFTLDEVKEYISRERQTGIRIGNTYRSHDLVPSFCITGT